MTRLDQPPSGMADCWWEVLAPLQRRILDETGASLVIVEHDIPLVRSVADRMIAMDRGAVIANGEPNAVLSHPAVVTAYLGVDSVDIERSSHTAPEPTPTRTEAHTSTTDPQSDRKGKRVPERVEPSG